MAADALIQAALYSHLKGTTLPTAMSIAPEGKNFTPVSTKPYLRPTYMLAETDAPYLSDDDEVIRAGLYQIDVFWPENQGVADALTVAAALSVRFRRGTRFDLGPIDLRLSRAPSILPVMQESGWIMIPVRATWAASAPVTA